MLHWSIRPDVAVDIKKASISREGSKLRPPFARRDPQNQLLDTAQYDDLAILADAGIGQQAVQVVDAADGVAVEPHHQVPFLESGLRCGTAFLDIQDADRAGRGEAMVNDETAREFGVLSPPAQ